MTAHQLFLNALSDVERAWLAAQLKQAQRAPPDSWRSWSVFFRDRSYHGGYMHPQRFAEFMVQLPLSQKVEREWCWDCFDMSADQMSCLLQSWLVDQHQAGRMSDWRHEMQDWVFSSRENEVLTIERSGFRHLGIRSRAVHVNGFLPDGRVLVGKRSMTKRIDPGLYDNLTAGGICAGESALQTFERELREEAGIDSRSLAVPQWRGSIHVCNADHHDWHSETLTVCNLALGDGLVAVNQDGEVAQFDAMSASEAAAKMHAGEFTRDGIISLAFGLGFAPSPDALA